MNEAKRLLSVLICSFSWVLMDWMSGSISRFRGARRLLLTFTAVIGGEISGLEPQPSLETIPERVRGFLLFLLIPTEEWLLNDLTVFFVFSISAVRVGENRKLRGWMSGGMTAVPSNSYMESREWLKAILLVKKQFSRYVWKVMVLNVKRTITLLYINCFTLIPEQRGNTWNTPNHNYFNGEIWTC